MPVKHPGMLVERPASGTSAMNPHAANPETAGPAETPDVPVVNSAILRTVVEVGEGLDPPASDREIAKVAGVVESKQQELAVLATTNMSFDNDPRLADSRIQAMNIMAAKIGFAMLGMDESPAYDVDSGLNYDPSTGESW